MELEKLREIIGEVLNIDPDTITADTTFVDDLGADSLDIFQIIMGMEEEYDIELENEVAEQIRTVGDAVEAIRAIREPGWNSDRRAIQKVTGNNRRSEEAGGCEDSAL